MRLSSFFVSLALIAGEALCVIKKAPLIELGESPSTSIRENIEVSSDPAETTRDLDGSSRSSRRRSRRRVYEIDNYTPDSYQVVPLNLKLHVRNPLLFRPEDYVKEKFDQRMRDWQISRNKGEHKGWETSHDHLKKNDIQFNIAMRHLSHLGPNTGAIHIPEEKVIYRNSGMSDAELFAALKNLNFRLLISATRRQHINSFLL